MNDILGGGFRNLWVGPIGALGFDAELFFSVSGSRAPFVPTPNIAPGAPDENNAAAIGVSDKSIIMILGWSWSFCWSISFDWSWSSSVFCLETKKLRKYFETKNC